MNTMHSVPPLAAKSSFPPTWRKVLFASVGKGAWKRPGKGARLEWHLVKRVRL